MAELRDFMARPQASIRSAVKNGWGSGWPHCQDSAMVALAKVGGTIGRAAGRNKFLVRKEIGDLVAILLEATERIHGYDVKPDQTGCFDCRPIRGTEKNEHPVPSNHSWGLAIDINWESNPRGAPFRCDLPPAVVPMWWECGFFWGGWYKSAPVDPMHFEYVHRPQDVATHLAIAKSTFEGDDMPTPLRTDDDFRALIFRIEGILRMRDNVDNHVNNPQEPNELTKAIRALSDQATQARAAALEAKQAAQEALQAAQRQPDEALVEAIVERVVQRVLAAGPRG